MGVCRDPPIDIPCIPWYTSPRDFDNCKGG